MKQTVYSSVDIKPRNSNLTGARATSSQTEERTNLAQSDKTSVTEEEGRAKAKTSTGVNTSHLVAANYSFFPADNEDSEVDHSKNTKVRSLCRFLQFVLIFFYFYFLIKVSEEASN